MPPRTLSTILSIACLLFAAGAPSALHAAAGALAGLPSAQGPHVARIKALKEGEWLNLGPPAADPRCGQAMGRSWSSKMPYAPELGGAFLYGQGVHGYIKPDGHFMDDLFFYDMNAHRWICIWRGLNTRTFEEDVRKGIYRLNEHGQLVDREGQPVPFSAIPGHSYQGHTYDFHRGLYIFGYIGGRGIGGEQHIGSQPWYVNAVRLLESPQSYKPDQRVINMPYHYNTRTGKFERHPENGAGGTLAVGDFAGVYFYLPTKRLVWYYTNRGQQTLAYHPDTHRWTFFAAGGSPGPKPPGMTDIGAVYDSKRDRIYLGRGAYSPPQRPDEGNVYVYDVKTNTWSNPPTPKKPHPGFMSGTNFGSVHYDTAADRVLSFHAPNGEGVIMFYNPEKQDWEGIAEIPPGVKIPRHQWHGFYSPALNAHFIYKASDSGADGTMWVYRYRKAGA